MNTIDFKFKYPGETEEETFEYDIPDEIIIAGVKKYIKDTFNVRIVGEDGDVWRMCFGIGKTYGDDDEFSELFDEAVDAEENWFREKLKDQAFEAFKDEWEAEHGGINESLNEGDGDESNRSPSETKSGSLEPTTFGKERLATSRPSMEARPRYWSTSYQTTKRRQYRYSPLTNWREWV